MTSVISGLLVAYDGMRSMLVLALAVMAASFLHVARLTVPEPVVVATGHDDTATARSTCAARSASCAVSPA